MAINNLLKSWFAPAKSSASDNLASIVAGLAKERKQTPEEVLAALRCGAAVPESSSSAASLHLAASHALPDTPCLDGAEWSLVMMNAGALPAERKEHLRRCPACQSAQRLTTRPPAECTGNDAEPDIPDERYVSAMAVRLAQPPEFIAVVSSAVRSATAFRRSSQRLEHLRSLDEGLQAQQPPEPRGYQYKPVAESAPASANSARIWGWLLNPARVAVVPALMVIALTLPYFTRSSDWSVPHAMVPIAKEIRGVPLGFQGTITASPVDPATGKKEFALEIKAEDGLKTYPLRLSTPWREFLAAHDPPRAVGAVQGQFTLDSKGKLAIIAHDISFQDGSVDMRTLVSPP